MQYVFIYSREIVDASKYRTAAVISTTSAAVKS